MCNFKSWYFDEGGYIIQCSQCNSFRVCFGSTMLTLSENDYQAFFDLVCYKTETHVSMCEKQTKCIVLPTPCKAINIILNEIELQALYTMLQEADTEIKTQQLVDLFNTPTS
jgi:hypothetical protein